MDAVQCQATTTHVWLLDSNQCKLISMDQQGVDQAVKRFVDNDPHSPRPFAATGSTDKGFRKMFARRYLETSGSIIGADQGYRALPNNFIGKVVETICMYAWKVKRKQPNDRMYTPNTKRQQSSTKPKNDILTVMLTNPDALPRPSPLTLILIRVSFLHFHVGPRKDALLLVIIAGGIARGRGRARRSAFRGGVFDLIFGWHCFISNVGMDKRVT